MKWLYDILGVGQKIELPKMKTKKVPVIEKVEEEDDNYQDIKWGAGKIVKGKVIENEEVNLFEWEVAPDGRNRLKGMELDEFDWLVIREKGLKPDSFKLAKPYIVSGWEYKEVAKILGYSVSWVQKIGPAVKEAAKRRKSGSPTPED
jgi:hypothetical protein